ncbi:MAG: hypothetical protein HFJ35_01775 [Clostridia bacterium]|nr:hypothetical protein [Clostridia bacterium]
MVKKIVVTIVLAFATLFTIGGIVGFIYSYLYTQRKRGKLNFPAGLCIASFLRKQRKTYI